MNIKILLSLIILFSLSIYSCLNSKKLEVTEIRKIEMTQKELKEKLSPLQFKVTQE